MAAPHFQMVVLSFTSTADSPLQSTESSRFLPDSRLASLTYYFISFIPSRWLTCRSQRWLLLTYTLSNLSFSFLPYKWCLSLPTDDSSSLPYYCISFLPSRWLPSPARRWRLLPSSSCLTSGTWTPLWVNTNVLLMLPALRLVKADPAEGLLYKQLCH